MVSQPSSQVWFLFLFGTVLAMCGDLECVCALNNRYCHANNIERVWPNMIRGDSASADFDHCQSWCEARGRSYTTNKYKLKNGRIDCVCCCGDALRPPPLPSQGNNE
ncbi:hypothetical protein MKX03_000743 [Papaver bracteatum]|nr:hypothetical protein MKX03_000743 [Papaver bracteatum]